MCSMAEEFYHKELVNREAAGVWGPESPGPIVDSWLHEGENSNSRTEFKVQVILLVKL